MKMIGDWNKGWQAIAAEMSDYSKRSFEDGTATFEKLLGAKSLEQAFEIQTSFAKRAYDDYMHQMTKIGSMYTEPRQGRLQAGREGLAERPLMGRHCRRLRSHMLEARRSPRAFFASSVASLIICRGLCPDDARQLWWSLAGRGPRQIA